MSTSHAEIRNESESRAIREARQRPWWFAGFGAVTEEKTNACGT